MLYTSVHESGFSSSNTAQQPLLYSVRMASSIVSPSGQGRCAPTDAPFNHRF